LATLAKRRCPNQDRGPHPEEPDVIQFNDHGPSAGLTAGFLTKRRQL
jgi:hypothetical protein